VIDELNSSETPCTGDSAFTILESEIVDFQSTPVSADIATCDDCLRELRDTADRRFAYPFLSCTNCGPRFTTIRDLPMTGLPPRWRLFACARPAKPSTTIPPTAASTRSPTPVPIAAIRRSRRPFGRGRV
jgi:HypF finger protein